MNPSRSVIPKEKPAKNWDKECWQYRAFRYLPKTSRRKRKASQ